MKVTNNNLRLLDFEPWSGATETRNNIIKNGKEQQFNELIEELNPDGLTTTELNDLLWFDNEWLYEQLDIEETESI